MSGYFEVKILSVSDPSFRALNDTRQSVVASIKVTSIDFKGTVTISCEAALYDDPAEVFVFVDEDQSETTNVTLQSTAADPGPSTLYVTGETGSLSETDQEDINGVP